ncbi:hypothetical protein, partial [Enterobacter hormaechei]|uniref:hypothetical protein n=1 Tax=Enterobacter hormaechei TaxID=158836 RepID=UPI00200D2942
MESAIILIYDLPQPAPMPIHALQPARLPLAAALALCLLPATRAFAQDGATTLDSIQVSGSWL